MGNNGDECLVSLLLLSLSLNSAEFHTPAFSLWTGGSRADKTFLPLLFSLSPPFQFGELLIVVLCDAPMLVFELDFLIEFGLLRDLSYEKRK